MRLKHSNTLLIDLRKLVLLVCIPLLFAACGGGADRTSNATNETGTFSLAITDGPVDNAVKVVVEFTGVSIKPADGDVIEFLFEEPRSIDLLELQGNISEALVTGEVVAAGSYEWIRLHVNAEEDNILDSYLELNDGTQQELRIPSGAQTGLKLVSGFTVPAGGSADFTIDFDLRKSITNPPGMASAILKPALRIVDNVTVGSITGTVDFDLINSVCADPTVDDGSVYVYTGADVTPTDIQGADSDPLASALVNVVGDGYVYEIGFLLEGTYTVAYTCDAANDDPAVADTIVFEQSATVTVLAGVPAVHDFVSAVEEETLEQ